MNQQQAAKYLMELAVEMYTNQYRPGSTDDDYTIAPQVVLIKGERSAYMPEKETMAMFSSREAKHALGDMIEMILKANMADMVAVASEAFAVYRKPGEEIPDSPSECEDRQQMLLVTVFDKQGTFTMTQRIGEGKVIGTPDTLVEMKSGNLVPNFLKKEEQ